MKYSFQVDGSGHRLVFVPSAASPWFVSLLICVLSALSGCTNPRAPSPTPNPHPRHTLKLKISVEHDSGVNRVEVQSGWVVSQMRCAPIVYPEGYRKVKQVNAPEKVRNLGDNFVADIIVDRFLPGDCQWVVGGVGIKLFHDDHLLAATGVGADVLRGSEVSEGTCSPSPDKIHPPICFSKKQESFLRRHFKGVFNITVRSMP